MVEKQKEQKEKQTREKKKDKKVVVHVLMSQYIICISILGHHHAVFGPKICLQLSPLFFAYVVIYE
jgi:hypothetical protein